MRGKIIAMLVAFGLLAALIITADPAKVAELLSKADPRFVAAGLLIWPVGMLLRVVRWRYLLACSGTKLPFASALKVFIAGLAISNMTPGKTGDPIRSVLLKKVSGNSVGLTLPSVIIERALDVGTMILLALSGLTLLLYTSVAAWLAAAIALYAGVFITAMAILSSEKRTKWAIERFYSMFSWIPRVKKMRERLDQFAADMHRAFRLYGNAKVMAVSAVMSLGIWAYEGVLLWLAFGALGMNLDLLAIIAMLSAITLVAVLTFLPGGLGSSELLTVSIFTVIFSLSMPDIIAASLLSRFMGFWIYIGLGAFFVATMRYKYPV